MRMRSGIGEGLVAWQDGNPNLARRGELGVDRRFDRVDEVAGHPLELEVHSSRAGLHVPTGHQRAIVPPDDAAERVQGRVRAHQREPPRPVEIDFDSVADQRRLDGGIELVDDLAARLSGAADLPGSAVRCAQENATIGRLATAARVEDGRVEDDERCGRTFGAFDRDHACLGAAGVCIRVADLQVHGASVRDDLGSDEPESTRPPRRLSWDCNRRPRRNPALLTSRAPPNGHGRATVSQRSTSARRPNPSALGHP